MSERSRAIAAGLWIALLGLSLALSYLAATHDTLPGDTGIATWAQDLAFPGRPISDFVRGITSTEVVLGFGATLVLALWTMGHRRQAILLAAGLVLLLLIQSGVKEVVGRPRPDSEIIDLRASFSSPSFPSGHVLSGTYLYGFLLYISVSLPLEALARWLLALLALFLLVLNGPASVWLGAHWPSDILGGYAWAFILLIPAIGMDYDMRAP